MPQITEVVLLLGYVKIPSPRLDPDPDCFGVGLAAVLPPCLQQSSFGRPVSCSLSLLSEFT